MSLTSLQVCMDSSDWLQGTLHEDSGLDSSSPSGGDMLTCSRPLIERRLRPPHDQALKCPRCDSTHTKFCYYNNYSLSQPRYFCKTCRRYWTKGGTLRNIPVGGGCRKNKKVSSSSKKVTSENNHNQSPLISQTHNPTDLHLSFHDHNQVQFSHLSNIFGSAHHGFMENNPNASGPIDFMESKSFDLIGNGEMGMVSSGFGEMGHGLITQNFHGLCSPFGVLSTTDGMDTCQRLMLPYDDDDHHQSAIDVKPNTKLLSLDWQDQGCSDAGKDTFGYISNLGSSWTGMMNGYGSSATNPLV